MKKAKWSLSNEEPEDLEDFRSNDEIGLPPKGIYRFVVDRIEQRETQNGDERLLLWLRIQETDPDKKRWNGYTVWEGFNLIPQSLPYLKRFLGVIGLTWKDFINNSMIDDSVDPPRVGKIANVVIGNPKKPLIVRASTKDDNRPGVEGLAIARFIPMETDEEVDARADAEEADDADDTDDELGVEPAEDDGDDTDEAEGEEDEEFEPWTEDDLNDMDLSDLKAEAKEFGIKVTPRMKKPALVEAILEAQEEGDEDEEDDADDADDEDLSEDELKAKAKELGASPREVRRANTVEKLQALIQELKDEPPF